MEGCDGAELAQIECSAWTQQSLHVRINIVNSAVTLLAGAYPFPTRSAPGATLFSAGHTMLKSPQSLSSELSPQSFCLLHVSVELMQRPAEQSKEF